MESMADTLKIRKKLKSLPEATTSKKLNALARSTEVFRRHVQDGTPMEELAQEYGVDVAELQRGLNQDLSVFAKEMQYSREIYRALELSRLEQLQSAFWDDALSGSASSGRMVLSIMEKRSKLLGLDAPKEVNIRDWREAVAELGIEPDQLLHTVAGQLKSARGTEISSSPTGFRQAHGRSPQPDEDGERSSGEVRGLSPLPVQTPGIHQNVFEVDSVERG